MLDGAPEAAALATGPPEEEEQAFVFFFAGVACAASPAAGLFAAGEGFAGDAVNQILLSFHRHGQVIMQAVRI